MDANYIKLAKIVHQMKRFYDCTDEIESLLDSEYEINYAVPADCPLKNYEGYTLLHFAVDPKIHGNKNFTAIVNLLLKRNADFTLKDKRNFTPLRLALEVLVKDEYRYYNLKATIDQLLSAHMVFHNSVNVHSDDGISHMHIACIFRKLDVAKLFLKSGVSVHEAIHDDSSILPGFTCIHIAMMNKHKDMVHLLLKYGADCNCLNAERMSPLHLVDDKKLDEDLLVRIESMPYNKESLKNERILQLITRPSEDEFSPLYDIGLTQLHALCIRYHSAAELDILEEILEKNDDDVNATVNLNSPIWAGQSALHFAVHRNLQMVLLLLKNGAHLMAKDANDITPLDLCLKNFKPSDIAEILETQKNFEAINFQNGTSLIETLIAFDKTPRLSNYLETFDSKTTIPLDSPLWPGFSILHLAVILSQGWDKTKVNLCLKHDADVTVQDANGMTALHLAFHKEKWSCIDPILRSHSDPAVNPVDCKSLSHFHVACILGKLKLVKQFLDTGLNLNIPIHENLRYMENYSSSFNSRLVVLPAGSTPLHMAVALKLKSLAKLLLSFKADPFSVDGDDFTWIHRGFLNGSCSFFSDVFWHHPHIFKSNPVAAGGLTHFHVACYGGTLKAVKALLPLASKINEPLTDELTKYYPDKKHPELMCSGQTALHLAVLGSSLNTVYFLLRNGADLEAKNSNGLSPLYVALSSEKSSIIQPIASELVKNKNWTDKNGITLLHLACALGKNTLINICLKRGDDVNKRINIDSPVWPGESPIQVACKYNEYTVAETLLNHFVKSIDALSNEQELHGSVKRRRIQMTRERLVVNSEGLTVFHVSCGTENPDIVENFIKLGIDIDAPTDYLATTNAGCSPLHFAVKFGSDAVLETLLKHGANISSENSNGYNPVQLAAVEHSSNLGIFFRMCDVDVKMKTAADKTLLDLLMKNYQSQSSDFLGLLSRGAAENISFRTMTRLVNHLTQRFSENNFSSLLTYIPNLTEVDYEGRNVIHHIEAEHSFIRNKEAFCGNLESLVKHGCELDHQDKLGETPLHYSVRHNLEKFKALMLIGADLSITDINGKTPFATFFETPFNHGRHFWLGCPMLQFVRNVIASGLDPTLRDVIQNHCDKTIVITYEQYLDTSQETLDLSSMKQIKITKSFALRDVFAEKMVMEFPVMPSQQREAIIGYLEVSNVMREQFPDWLPLYKMQIRRARKREESFESTFASLRDILDPRLPDHVLESILVYLNTKDWNNVSNVVVVT